MSHIPSQRSVIHAANYCCLLREGSLPQAMHRAKMDITMD